MLKNSYKILFILTLMVGTLIAITSSSWFSIWMGLEINLLSFIPLMMSSKNLFSSESSLKYFLTQTLASTIFLFAVLLLIIFLNYKMNLMNAMFLMISSTMLIKSGSAPFHFWFPSVMEGLSWTSNMILMTWQKIAPLMILSYTLSSILLFYVILLCMIFGSFGGLNQTSMRKLMAFSSINHLGWMMAGMLYSEMLWSMYFIFYSILSLTIIVLFNNFKLYNLNQTFKFYNSNLFLKVMIFLPLLSLGGLPPFLGFLPKWIIIEMMISMENYFLLVSMLFLTLITLYFYLRICYSAFLMNYLEVKWNYKFFYSNKSINILIYSSFLSIFGLFLINFVYLFL